jgi:hypothetical protein
MKKYYKKILIAMSLFLALIFFLNLIPCSVKAQFQELLWQRVFWGCRDSSTNEGIHSMAVFRGKLYIGTLNLAGGEVWYFDGKDWKKLGTEETPFGELPLGQQFIYGIQSPYAALAFALLALANLLSLISLASLLPYLAYLWQLLTQPFLYFSKKKRKWGVVYDSLTKLPIDLAIVRLFDVETKKLIETKVTNLEGKYLFIVDFNRKYYVTAAKPGYDFPTKIMAAEIKDKEYDNLYHGEEFQIGKEKESDQGFITYNIPLDPQPGYVAAGGIGKKMKTDIATLSDYNKLNEEARRKRNSKIIWSSRIKTVNKFIAYLGPILGLTSFILNPSLFTYLLLMAHALILLLFRRLALGKRVKPWGKVYDIKNLSALPQTIVRVFDTTYGRLMQVYVTKSDGRYGFLIGEGVNSNMVATKEGYIFPDKEIKIVSGQDVQNDIGMKKIKK